MENAAQAGLLGQGDSHARVPHARTMGMQEVRLLALRRLCDGIDLQLFGDRK